MPAIFQSPGSATPEGRTNYVAVTGKQCAFGVVQDDMTRYRQSRHRHMLGTAHTAVIIEANDLLAVTWTRPDDLRLASPNDSGQVPSWFGLRDDGLLAGYLDGQVHTILRTNDPQAIIQDFAVSGGRGTPLEFADP